MKCKNILHTSINTAVIYTIYENMKCKNILHTSINTALVFRILYTKI